MKALAARGGTARVKVSIHLASGASEPGDIQGIGFDLNGDVDALFTNGTMSIGSISTIGSYTGPLVHDVAEQSANADFNVQPEGYPRFILPPQLYLGSGRKPFADLVQLGG
ncbi:hypothetical protein [Amaricoccus solimangrovi]|uniref:Uncharacterized protein n=1 Tax=Amaricoccus solimangrovi TaxID=2589815 RepID=A0A501WD35_9RHOB|nr:hypothetical protein [Amaricoccus solimangrovi]TPE45111.1 hypothetical protein FJM51_22675 [Amaricoccus solimangrovi]